MATRELLNTIKTKVSVREIRSFLERTTLRTGEGLFPIYESAMEKINRSEFRELAHQSLAWAARAFKSSCYLDRVALQHALATEPGSERLYEDNYRDLQQVVSCASPFLDAMSLAWVRLAHSTMDEFFATWKDQNGRDWGTGPKDWLPCADAYMTRVCVAYLTISNKMQDTGTRVSAALLEYARTWWGHHARCAIQEPSTATVDHGFKTWVGDPDEIQAEIQDYMIAFDYFNTRREYTPKTRMEALSEAAFYGLWAVVKEMVLNGYLEDDQDPTPLLACFEGLFVTLESKLYRAGLYHTHTDKRHKRDKVSETYGQVVDALRASGQDFDVYRNDRSALSSAKREGYSSLAAMLRHHGAKEHVNEAGGVKLLRKAMQNETGLGQVVNEIFGASDGVQYRSGPLPAVILHGDEMVARGRPMFTRQHIYLR